MRIALVVNPGSGGGTDPDALAGLLRRQGADVELHDFSAIDDVPLAGFDRLAVATGDGGLGSAAARAVDAGIPLAVLPSGTANDFAATLGLPHDPGIAAVLAARADAPLRTLDLAWAGEIPFLNTAACGISVAAAGYAERLKRVLGPAAYATGAVLAGATETARSYRVVVDGEEVFAGPAWQVIVAGTGAFGNGSEVEEADPTDGRLDVAVLHGASRVALARHAWGLRAGGLTAQDDVAHHRGRAVVVEGATGWNVDGERCDAADAGRFRLDGRAQVVVPG
jgi:diacylglycerol kinase (ATP)